MAHEHVVYERESEVSGLSRGPTGSSVALKHCVRAGEEFFSFPLRLVPAV